MLRCLAVKVTFPRPRLKKTHSCFNSLAFRDLSSTLKKNYLVVILFEQNSSQLVSSNWALKNVLWPLGHASLLVAYNVNAFTFS